MIISPGQLHSSAQLLDVLSSAPISPAALQAAGGVVLVCPTLEILNICARCGWVEVDGGGNLRPSKRGHELKQIQDFQERLRQQLADVISTARPAWSKKIMHGRHELSRFAPDGVCQCFREAGLMAAVPSDGVVKWWDEMANAARGLRSASLLSVGRAAERLSIAYERNRTGREPFWQAIESAFSGYDLLSAVSSTDSSPLQIEVKASELRLKDAVLHLSQNEWECALQARYHRFHLWQLGTPPLMAVVESDQMAAHVPKDQGDGAWESLKVPFRAFLASFRSPVDEIPKDRPHAPGQGILTVPDERA